MTALSRSRGRLQGGGGGGEKCFDLHDPTLPFYNKCFYNIPFPILEWTS